MIPVGHLAPSGCWDENLLTRLFDNELYPTGLDFKHFDGYPSTEGAAVVVPGRYWHQHTDQITEALARYKWVLGFRTGDEEDLFDISAVTHGNLRWWVQTPRTDQDYGAARLFGVGFPPHFNNLQPDPPAKMTVFLKAQNTHPRRKAAFSALESADLPFLQVEETAGFTLGTPAAAYAWEMCHAKVAPAPAGPESPDTFRLYEALESHCVPIADDVTPAYDSRGYWRMLFPDCPFPVLTDYNDLSGYINDQLEIWPRNANRIAAWWMRTKRRYTHWLKEDLEALGAL